jgi:hypothetical protein
VSRIEDLARLLESKTITFTKLADESGIVLDTDTAQVFSLNESAAFLIDALGNGARTRDDLVKSLVDEFEVDESTAREDVEAFVNEIADHLIKNR